MNIVSPYLLINLYAPNKDKDLKEFFKNLLNTSKKEKRKSTPRKKFLMRGDFNCPLNPAIDKKEAYLINENRSYHVLGIVYKMNLM